MKRPFLVVVIGYMIGILWGLYFSFSIVLFYFPIIMTYLVKKRIKKKKSKFRLFSIKRYFRYIKLFISKNVIFIVITVSIISNTIILVQNKKYETTFQNEKSISLVATVVGRKEEKSYQNQYKIKIKDNFFYLIVDKKILLQYGDKIQVEGTYQKPKLQRNEGGYHEEQFLKSKKIIGKIKATTIQMIEHNKGNVISRLANETFEQLEQKINQIMDEKRGALLKGILLGDTSQIEKEIQEDFRVSNIAHILAVSGMHVAYLIVGIKMVLEKLLGKRATGIFIIVFLTFYCFVTNFTPSIIRASMMMILVFCSKLINRKNDTINSLAFSLCIILWDNPYAILNLGLQFSYLGTIGILIFYPRIEKVLRGKKNFFPKIEKLIQKLKEAVAVMISAQIVILPLSLVYFHYLGIYFLISNLLVSFIIGFVIILGYFILFLSFFLFPIVQFIKPLLLFALDGILAITQISQFPFSKIYIPMPTIWQVIIYYIGIFLFYFFLCLYQNKKINSTHRRIINIIAMIKIHVRENRKKYFVICFSIIICCIFISIFPTNLKIHFIDVGQGDSTLIETPLHQCVLIDGGGSQLNEFDVGKNTLIPYLLNKGYTTIDYIVISHFDQDHVGGLITVMQELEVKQVIIGKQFETCENYQEFMKIVKEKKIKVQVVEAGQRIKIEKDLYFDVLWPDSGKAIGENVLNNNSLVCKLVYHNFSILFTGDIEEIAEKAILEKYKNTNTLKSAILKVAHHGSKSSSIEEFLKVVKPKMALIGVGENNTFGHPNSGVLERLEGYRSKIFRTDENGEITIKVNKKGKIWLDKMLN